MIPKKKRMAIIIIVDNDTLFSPVFPKFQPELIFPALVTEKSRSGSNLAPVSAFDGGISNYYPLDSPLNLSLMMNRNVVALRPNRFRREPSVRRRRMQIDDSDLTPTRPESRSGSSTRRRPSVFHGLTS